MKIKVKIYSGLKRYISPSAKELGNKEEWEIPAGSTVGDVLDRLGFPSIVVVAISVNSVISRDKNRALKEGDQVALRPPLSGG